MNAFRVAPAALCVVALFLAVGVGEHASGFEIRIVVPNGQENTEGNSRTAPSFMDTGFTAQLWISASDFSNLPETHRVITAIAFRPDASVTEPRTVTWPDTQWFLSTTTKNWEDMGPFFRRTRDPT